MDDLNLKQINVKAGVISIGSALNKVIKVIQQSKSKSGNEIEYLKRLCKSENQLVTKLAIDAFVKLVEDGFLDTSHVLPFFISLLSNASFGQLAGLGNAIFEVLLIDLKRRCSNNPVQYICQFDLKPPQHPLILLLSNKEVSNLILFNSKVVEICNHHDKVIKANSIEFLRPVFLYILCNPTIHPESRVLWKTLLNSSVNQHLILDILAWSKFSTPQICLFTNSLIFEALESKHETLMTDLCVYLASITKHLVANNIDPTTNFRNILTILHKSKNVEKYYNILIMILADLLQQIPPKYVRELMRCVKFILQKYDCHYLGLYMLLECSIQWISISTYITDYLEDMDFIIKYVTNQDYNIVQQEPIKSWILCANPEIAKYQELCSIKDIAHFLVEKASKNLSFSDNINQILRALFLFPGLEMEQFKKVFDLLMILAKSNDDLAFKLLMLILYKLANDMRRPRIKLMLMQNLASLGVKDHVLGTLKVLSKDIDRSFSYDLYLRLWKAEPRTYPFLYNILKDTSLANKGDEWENNVAKAYTIREICKIKPEQHGADLLNLFSDILNRPMDENSEIPITLAIDAITILCENRVVNVVSTWKVLGFKFNFEKRPQVVKSLCRFFAQISSIHSSTLEFEKLFIDIIHRLWLYVIDFDDREIIGPALDALQAFAPDTMNIKQIPEIFRQGIEVPEEEENADLQIPGECWIQMIQFVNYQAIEDAGNLVSHHIYQEMKEYRGGVYLLPEGRPEPVNLKYLPKRSILAALISYLIRHGQSTKIVKNELILTEMLRVLSQDYPKPIPPLDWCFLHEYFSYSFEMKKYCFKIAAKQLKTSGTAKRLVENYLNEIVQDEQILTDDDLLVVYDNFKDLSEATRVDLFKRFTHKSLQYAYDMSTAVCFENGCLFENVLHLLPPAVQNKNESMIEENVNAICDFVENYFNRIPINTKTFIEYKKLVTVFPTSNLNNIIKPSNWTEINPEKLIKAVEIHSELLENCSFEGLNDLLMAVGHQNDEKVRQHFLNALSKLLEKSFEERFTSGWISLLIGQIQTALTTNTMKIDQILFMIDVFLTTIIKLSGVDVLIENNLGYLTSFERLEKLPCSLYLLFQQNMLRDVENKIYEFLYYLYNHKEISTILAEFFKKALISCKNQSYFTKSWQKCVSMRRI